MGKIINRISKMSIRGHLAPDPIPGWNRVDVGMWQPKVIDLQYWMVFYQNVSKTCGYVQVVPFQAFPMRFQDV